MLNVENLSAGYGTKQVLSDVSLKVQKGEIVVLVGPNGAGKSTLLNAISGMVKVKGGQVSFGARDITRARPDQVIRGGLAHCPEGRQIFQRLTVEENLIAAHLGRGPKSATALREQVYGLFPILLERRHSSANRLSGGQQQMLAIGRALMAEPDLLMLDEPSLGLAPKVITQIFQIILDLAEAGMSILLVEQNVRLALEVADYAYVLEGGRMRLDGPADQIAQDPQLAHLYLGAAVAA